MLQSSPKLRLNSLLVGALISTGATSKQIDSFDACKSRVYNIMNGTETFGEYNNETIHQFIYTGPVGGMNEAYAAKSRNSFVTITTEGCRVLCEDPIDWYWKTDRLLTLGIISNWVLPIIAMLAALPYDSLHRKNAGSPWFEGRFWKTGGAVLNWLGSPQTSLTATLFNIHQIRKCFHETLPSGNGLSASDELLKRDAYYTLCCVGQFKLLHVDQGFLTTLVYGLFRPICNVNFGEEGETDADGRRALPGEAEARAKAQKWTQDLLHAMAFQLRMARRRGVYPTFLSVILFFIAYIVSVVTAFGSLGDRTTTHSLAFGILISWLPLLVLFAIIDRNPISADRTKNLITRWMWNVEAIRQWESNSDARPEHPNWWSQAKEKEAEAKEKKFEAKEKKAGARWKAPVGQGEQPTYSRSYLGGFVGQGRQIGFHGLPYAVLVSVYDDHKEPRRIQPIKTIVNKATERLERGRPACWWWIAIAALALVLVEIGAALMISCNIPTVGLGCRAASYVIYAFLSTLPWLLHLLPWFTKPGKWRKAICHIFSFLSTLTLCFITFAAFSGVLKNCFCRGGMSGYIDFEDAPFYKDPEHFDVAKWWQVSAVLGVMPMVICFIVAWFLLETLKPLWQASERGNLPSGDADANMNWLV